MNQASNVLELKKNHQTANSRINEIISANPDAFTSRALSAHRQDQVALARDLFRKEKDLWRHGWSVSTERLLTPDPMELKTNSVSYFQFGNWQITIDASKKDFGVMLFNPCVGVWSHNPTLLRRVTELHTGRASYNRWRRMVMSQLDEALPAIIKHLKSVHKGETFHSFTCTPKSEKLMRRIDGIEVRKGFAFLVL